MSECTGTPKWCCGRHDFLRRQGAHFATPSEEKIGIYHNRIQGLERQQAIDQQTIASRDAEVQALHHDLKLLLDEGVQKFMFTDAKEIYLRDQIRALESDLALAHKDIADVSDKLTAAEGMIGKMESAVRQARQTFIWLSEDSLKYPGTDAGNAGRSDRVDMDKALAALAEFRSGK